MAESLFHDSSKMTLRNHATTCNQFDHFFFPSQHHAGIVHLLLGLLVLRIVTVRCEFTLASTAIEQCLPFIDLTSQSLSTVSTHKIGQVAAFEMRSASLIIACASWAKRWTRTKALLSGTANDKCSILIRQGLVLGHRASKSPKKDVICQIWVPGLGLYYTLVAGRA